MKFLYRRMLALTLGLGLTGAVLADPAPARWGVPAARPPQWVPAVQPVSFNQVAAPRATSAPAATIDRPVPLVDTVPVPEPLPNPLPGAFQDPLLQPTAFSGQTANPAAGRSPLPRSEVAELSPRQFSWGKMPPEGESRPDKAERADKEIETAPLPRVEPLPNPTPAPRPASPTAPTTTAMPSGLPLFTGAQPTGPVPEAPGPVVGTPITGAPMLGGLPPVVGTLPGVAGPVVGAPIVSSPAPAPPVVPPPPMGANACPAPGCMGLPAAYTPACPGLVDGPSGCYTPWQTFYFSAEYLMWWTSGSSLPPLVTSGPVSGADTAILGRPGTVVLHGDERIFESMRSGARFSSGLWLDESKCFGLEGSYFFLGRESESFNISSTGATELARPIINLNSLSEAVQITASSLSPRAAGAISIDHTSQLWGADANFRSNVFCTPDCFIDVLLGWRTVTLEENSQIVEFVNSQEATIPGSNIQVDNFYAKSRFDGGQIGLAGEHRFWDRFTFGWKAKMAVGSTHQFVNILGVTTINGSAGNDGTYATGILAQGNYLGAHSRNMITLVPEVQFDLGYQVTPHLRAFVGYNFLYWSNVARAGEQINRINNPDLWAPGTPGAPSNPFVFHGGGFWAQGVNFGLEFRW